MIDNRQFSLILNKRHIWLIAAVISLIQFSIVVDESGITANYFMLFFVVFAFYGYRYSKFGFVYLSVIFLSYVIGLVLFSNADPYFVNRQFLSFIAGIIPVLLLFIRIRVPFDTVKLSVIIAAFIYSLLTVKNVCTLNVNIGDALATKGALGSQRCGFILAFGLLFSMENHAKSRFFYIISAITLFGIFCTFSRAAYLSTALGLVVYLICIIFKGKRKFNLKIHKSVVKYILIAVVIYLVVHFYNVEPAINASLTTMFNHTVRAFKDFFSQNIVIGDGSSEGTRLLLWKQAYDFVVTNNILLGSGMAGLYLVVPEYLEAGASAHNQYIDVFLRTGLIGLSIYLLMWIKLLKGFWSKSSTVFAGLVSMFVYGLFHETTKLTQGAFIFFILLNLITDKDYWKCYALYKFYKKPIATQIPNSDLLKP